MNAEHDRRKKKPRQKRNPIEAAISLWHEQHAPHLKSQHQIGDLVAQAPKRWTAYGPLVLLPAGSFTSAAWRDVLDSTTNLPVLSTAENGDKGGENSRGPAMLWKGILEEISGSTGVKLTHLAINEGIPLHSKERSAGEGGSENILRSPSGLRMLYGDFGPSTLSTSPPPSSALPSAVPQQATGAGDDCPKPAQVTEADFARAFWVSTKQNGITQTWAPRWTMFSRGNIKEKTRLLDFHDAQHSPDSPTQSPLSHRSVPADQRAGAVAVDLYAGIGYFAFCYAARGFRVVCWELNAWSVEGLRRGAAANGWTVRVVVPPDDGGGEEAVLRDVLDGDETIVVFLEDNARAAGRMRRLDELTRARGGDGYGGGGLRLGSVMHVNCGLLPSSRGSWATAWEVARETRRAWFHIHENVGVADIEAKKDEICQWFEKRMLDTGGEDGVSTDLSVEHVELVKTFAPGVWHCVYDLYVRRDTDTSGSIT